MMLQFAGSQRDIAVQYKENISGMKLTHPGGMLRVICFLCGKSTKSNTTP